MNNEPNVTELPMLVKNLRENILAHCEFAVLNARIWRARYEELVEQGFSEDQALVLCTKYG